MEFQDTKAWDWAFRDRPELETAEMRRRQRRRMLASVAVLGLLALLVAGVGGWLVTRVLAGTTKPGPEFPWVAGATFVMVILAGGVLKYLEPANRQSRPQDGRVSRALIESLHARLVGLEASAGRAALDDESRAKIVAALSEQVKADAASSVLPSIKIALEEKYRRHSLDQRFDQMASRLQRETQDLARRGNLNLVLGMGTTLAGVAILGMAVYQTPVGASYSELLAYYVPRATLVLLIELFAYFFLRLYKDSLSGIKYFQNELTNVESKQVALSAAMDGDSQELKAHVVQALSGTERNFVLQKDETTVELERDRIGRDTTLGLVDQLKRLIKSEKESG